MQERRQTQRIRLSLPASWESLRSQGRGTVCDLSSSGCFLLSGHEVKPGQLIRLRIDFDKHFVFAWGSVVYAIEEMGFAVQFLFSEENEVRSLTELIERMQASVI